MTKIETGAEPQNDADKESFVKKMARKAGLTKGGVWRPGSDHEIDPTGMRSNVVQGWSLPTPSPHKPAQPSEPEIVTRIFKHGGETHIYTFDRKGLPLTIDGKQASRSAWTLEQHEEHEKHTSAQEPHHKKRGRRRKTGEEGPDDSLQH